MIDLIVHVFRSPQIKTTTHLALMLAIARRCGDENGVCFAKQSTLAADTRLHPKTVAKAIGELEAMDPPLIERVKQGVDDSGRRLTDHLYICLQAVVLPATGPDRKGSPRLQPGSPVLPSHGVADSEATPHTTPHKRPLEETNEETDAPEGRELSEDESQAVDLDAAVAVIWAGVGERGRKRSAKAKVKKALSAALARRPKGVSVEDHLKRVLAGVRAYLSDPDTRKEGGKFEHGAHRTLENDVWESYLDDGAARVAHGERQPADPDLGTVDAPGPKLQRYWLETERQGLPWHAERGPRPGLPGCRVDADLQREFGHVPYAEADDDASAFL